MRWRPCKPADEAEFLCLTQEPMDGRIRLAWGLDQLRCPPGCDRFQAYVIEDEGRLVACAMAWDWPGGHRYLGGLRFAPDYGKRPRSRFWRNAFEDLLDGVDHAWTSIGKANTRARHLLESKAPWLPIYRPRQDLTSWFIPLSRSRREGKRPAETDADPGIAPLDGRFAAVRSGSGLAYRAGRLLHALGLPGISPAGRRMRLAEYRPADGIDVGTIREQLRAARGFDGLVVVLPEDSARSANFRRAVPRLAWTWESTLYSIGFDNEAPPPEIPDWKGSWL